MVDNDWFKKSKVLLLKINEWKSALTHEPCKHVLFNCRH